ncbi:MAG TPA: ABC transporter permease [Pseudonocardiaceae bacterium]|nr:ABC transporter permease [Pseudonocardiaceae bacterium]
MTSSDLAAESVRIGFRQYLAANPWPIMLTTEWPRPLLQCLFFTLLGQVTAGEAGGRFAFVGSVAMIMMLNTVVGVGDVPAGEKWFGTFYRLQMAGTPPAGAFALRAIPWTVQGLVTALLCLAIVGPVTGHGDVSLALLPTLPIFVLMAVTSTAAGLAAASPAIGRRADVVVSNGLVYLVITAGGLLVPAGRAPLLDVVGAVLPIRHGVLAVRGYLDGGPWLGEAALELIVGIGWGVLAAVLYRRQATRARATGSDDYA